MTTGQVSTITTSWTRSTSETRTSSHGSSIALTNTTTVLPPSTTGTVMQAATKREVVIFVSASCALMLGLTLTCAFGCRKLWFRRDTYSVDSDMSVAPESVLAAPP